MIKMRERAELWWFALVSYLITGAFCFHVELQVPRYADVGGHVLLKCEYNVPSEELHKVEWLKGSKKLFQYVKGRTPPFRNYTITGAVLDWKHSNERQLMLKDLDFDASGQYSCEVSTDTPIFTKPSNDEELIVMQHQLEGPHISFGKPEYRVGEALQVNCTSGPARPTPDVTWLINQKQADESLMRTFPEESPDSVTVQLAFLVEERHREGLELTCISTIPAFLGHHARHSQYADHRSHTIKVEVLPNTPPEPMVENSCSSQSQNLPFLLLLISLIYASWSLQ
ncbi:uncharacterized protein [Halyomorpha halys]